LAREPSWLAADRDYHFPAASGDLLTYFADYQDGIELIYRLNTSEGTIQRDGGLIGHHPKHSTEYHSPIRSSQASNTSDEGS